MVVAISGYTEVFISKDECRAFQVVEVNGIRFKLHCNTSRSSCVGFNSDLCVKAVKEDGTLANVFDFNSVATFESGSYCNTVEERRKKTKYAFDKMKEHLDLLFGNKS